MGASITRLHRRRNVISFPNPSSASAVPSENPPQRPQIPSVHSRGLWALLKKPPAPSPGSWFAAPPPPPRSETSPLFLSLSGSLWSALLRLLPGFGKAGSRHPPPPPLRGWGRGQCLFETSVSSSGARGLGCSPSPPDDPFRRALSRTPSDWKNLRCLPTAFGVSSLSPSPFETTSHEGKRLHFSFLLPTPLSSGSLRFPQYFHPRLLGALRPP